MNLQSIKLEACGNVASISDCSQLVRLRTVVISNIRDLESLAGVAAAPNLEAIIVQDTPKLTVDDIIWMGEHPTIDELAASVGVEQTKSSETLSTDVRQALKSGRKIHILPPYRGDHYIFLSRLLDCTIEEVESYVSGEFIKAVVELRSVKDEFEIAEIEKAVDVAAIMHTTAMKMGFPGNYERELAGAIEGIALSLCSIIHESGYSDSSYN
jgi:Xaa-Pro aminopeptidase